MSCERAEDMGLVEPISRRPGLDDQLVDEMESAKPADYRANAKNPPADSGELPFRVGR